MKLLIKQARVTDPSSPHNGKTLDLLIENGVITRISNSISENADHVIEKNGLHVSPGWADVFANFADPGYEYKETFDTGTQAAAAGGYTDVMVIPNTNPVVQNKAAVEYIIQRSKLLPVTVHPIGSITKNAEGKELAEMYDMKASGAVAFSDGLNCIQSAGLLVKALQYLKAVDGVLIQLPDDKSINPFGLINEGIVSTQLGLPGKPAMAEELIVSRDIRLADYTESKLHFTGISTATSLAYVRSAKEKGSGISCSVTPYHLFFTDNDLKNYDTNLKVNPPVRTGADKESLQQGIADGTIDCIATHHLPHEFDSKIIEFEYAKFGMTGLETSYAVLNTIMPGISQEQWITLLSVNPRKIFGLKSASVQEGNKAVLTLFDPTEKWLVDEKNFRSKSKNSPFTGMELTGKVTGIVNGDKVFLN